MSSQEIVHAYRHLYRGLLHAVQFSNMARDPVRTTLREAFRDRKGTFDAQAVKRTLWFLDAAAKERGLEHKILKNLVRMARQRQKSMPWKLRFHLQNVASHAKPCVWPSPRGGERRTKWLIF